MFSSFEVRYFISKLLAGCFTISIASDNQNNVSILTFSDVQQDNDDI